MVEHAIYAARVNVYGCKNEMFKTLTNETVVMGSSNSYEPKKA